MRIDEINNIDIICCGCLACVDVCPAKCVNTKLNDEGFVYTSVDNVNCIQCGKCFDVCPATTKSTTKYKQSVYAAYSKEQAIRMRGSSGGVFEEIAKHLISEGYYVCGATFEDMKLKHKIIDTQEKLPALLKSKYIQSNTAGIYADINKLLNADKKVFFCGTPCQVSALKNYVSPQKLSSLLTADIICHGVPSQYMFDGYISSLEERMHGKIVDYRFREKDNKYSHAHGYSFDIKLKDKVKTIHGIYTNSEFYNAFKNYSIFRNSCYDCKYATTSRVSDITLGDFWGIEKYESGFDTDAGVSMVVINSSRGYDIWDKIKANYVTKQMPIEYAIESNHCFSKSTVKPANRDAIFDMFKKYGYKATAKKFFGINKGFVYKLYWMIPPSARRFIRKIRGKL